ncbi:GGDEF domain-containing protein [Halomonas daqiaonensis]|uniref:diguanylate cyclase n=1 Tax=Halomonas daqiaonensis TaxID=650850 RepID=A0A1H7MUD6_9GAMM|nr:diguanylate cyclase [Halomonas daqiaonensis]SEL14295.1 diguanylate cyclase (GGDEF) domain-containing protein [Halomonas daqiaonensis]
MVTRPSLNLTLLALLLAVLASLLDWVPPGQALSLTGSLPILATTLCQLAWHHHHQALARWTGLAILMVLIFALASFLIPEHWIAHAAWNRLAERLIAGSLIVDWRPPLLVILCLIMLIASLLVRTRANLGSPQLQAMTALLLIMQGIETWHAPHLLSLAGSALEQAALWSLLAAQLSGVAANWRDHFPGLKRALSAGVLLTCLTLLFWHQQKTLVESNLRADTQVQSQRLAENLSREIHDHLQAMQRFANSWELQDSLPAEAQWARQAAPYHRDFQYFLNIAFIDTDSRIRRVYPASATNQRLLGRRLFDAQPEGRSAQGEALFSGRIGRTGIIELLQGEPGIIHYLPILDDDSQGPRGAVGMVVSLPVLADTLFRQTNANHFGLSLMTLDQTLAEREAIARVAAWQHRSSIDLDGLSLTLVSRPTLSLLLSRLSRQPVVSLTTGLLLAYLLYMVLFAHHHMASQQRLMVRSNRELRHEVRNRTRLQEEVEWLASHDDLTKLPNRRHFMQVLERHHQTRPLSLLICDIDHFKQINDTFGHLQGDHYLKRIGELGREIIESAGGVFARYGGEEFIACLPSHDAVMARDIAEHLREAIQHLDLRQADGRPLTISIGVTTQMDGELQIDALLQAADEALYAAKAEGRNRVIIAPPPSAPAGSSP